MLLTFAIFHEGVQKCSDLPLTSHLVPHVKT
jgi:hypothetical protein